MAMEANVMQQRVGRLGEKVNYARKEKVMPVLSPRARQAHDWIWEEIKNPDIFGLKPPRRWSIAGPPLYVPFTRDEGHFALGNLCTLARLHMIPELRRLQCWYLPKLPKIVHPVFYHPPVPRRRRAHTIWSRPQMWEQAEKLGRWDLCAQTDVSSEVEARLAANVFHDKNNTQRFYRRHKDDIEVWREEYRKYWYRRETPAKVQLYSNLRSRRWDLEELRKLDQWEVVKTSDPQSLHNSDFVPTSAEPSEGGDDFDHGDNLSTDDWLGS